MAIPYTFTNGTVAEADEVNTNFTYVSNKIHQIYTGSGFNTTIGASSTDEGSHELDAISSSDIADRDYAILTIRGAHSSGTGDTGDGGEVYLKVEIKEIGGSYGDVQAYEKTFDLGGHNENTTATFDWTVHHALTAGEKSSGFQIKVWSKSDTTGESTGSASFTNKCTVLSTIAG